MNEQANVQNNKNEVSAFAEGLIPETSSLNKSQRVIALFKIWSYESKKWINVATWLKQTKDTEAFNIIQDVLLKPIEIQHGRYSNIYDFKNGIRAFSSFIKDHKAIEEADKYLIARKVKLLSLDEILDAEFKALL